MEADERRKWTLLSSHGHVLVEIARNPRARVRDISAIIGITERATQAIIADLERAGYVERIRIGRRTHYVLHPDNAFRHSAQDGLQVGPFLDLLTATSAVVGPGLPAAGEPLLADAAAAALGPELEPGTMPGAEPGPLPAPALLPEPGALPAPALLPELGAMPAPGPLPPPGPLPADVMPLSSAPAPSPLLPPATETGIGPMAGTDVPEPGAGID